MSDVLETTAWSEDPGHWRYNPIGGGKAPHIFASEDDLWRWMYVLVMGGVDQA